MSSGPKLPPAGYLDAASGEPLHPAAAGALATAQDQAWADPSRLHHHGRQAAIYLSAAQAEVATVLGVEPPNVTFTKSATAALRVAVGRYDPRRASARAVVSAVEHSAAQAALAGWSGDVVTVGVNSSGRVDPADLSQADLFVVQSASHEVGTRQPIAEIARRWPEVPLLVDACASVGQDELPTGWTALVASARKWGGPAGLGILIDRRNRVAAPFADEPPDVPGAVAAAASLAAVLGDQQEQDRLRRGLVQRIRAALPALIPDLEIVGDPEDRLPHIVNLSCLYVDGEALVSELDRAGLAVTSGSACASDAGSPSHVLAAMGVLTHGNIRVSLPRYVNPADVDKLIAVLPGIVERLRAHLPH